MNFDNNIGKQIQSMAACGIDSEKIALALNIPHGELLEKYKNEVELAESLANAEVAKTLYKMATSGKSPQAAIFWLKSRANWEERVAIDVETNITGFRVVIDDEPEE